MLLKMTRVDYITDLYRVSGRNNEEIDSQSMSLEFRLFISFNLIFLLNIIALFEYYCNFLLRRLVDSVNFKLLDFRIFRSISFYLDFTTDLNLEY